MWYGGWGFGWLIMLAITVLFWAVVIAAVVALVRYFTGTHHGHQAGPRPLTGEPGWGGNRRAEDLLAERFARGEIDEEEYKRRLALLREHR
ncbi:SHOCT domain-containing protein [Streptomyces sp. NPDC002405]|uniref:SHOCT domain-containing protein n=1 Tax=unclassified Streptomyces TaxID=2593676 RepID=UPI00368933B1